MMIVLEEVREALNEFGPENFPKWTESIEAAGFEVDDPQMFAADLQDTLIDNNLPPEFAAAVALGLAAGAVIGRKESALGMESLDGLDVLEGTEWVPHND